MNVSFLKLSQIVIGMNNLAAMYKLDVPAAEPSRVPSRQPLAQMGPIAYVIPPADMTSYMPRTLAQRVVRARHQNSYPELPQFEGYSGVAKVVNAAHGALRAHGAALAHWFEFSLTQEALADRMLREHGGRFIDPADFYALFRNHPPRLRGSDVGENNSIRRATKRDMEFQGLAFALQRFTRGIMGQPEFVPIRGIIGTERKVARRLLGLEGYLTERMAARGMDPAQHLPTLHSESLLPLIRENIRGLMLMDVHCKLMGYVGKPTPETEFTWEKARETSRRPMAICLQLAEAYPYRFQIANDLEAAILLHGCARVMLNHAPADQKAELTPIMGQATRHANRLILGTANRSGVKGLIQTIADHAQSLPIHPKRGVPDMLTQLNDYFARQQTPLLPPLVEKTTERGRA